MVQFSIETRDGLLNIDVNPGSSIIFLGANGSGKTRLGVKIEEVLGNSGKQVHRLAAQRSLVMSPKMTPPSLEDAENLLFYGRKEANADYNTTRITRWKQKPATSMLDDFSALLGALYAEETESAIKFRQESILSKKRVIPNKTKLDQLKDIWESVLPHRKLSISHGNIDISTTISGEASYSAAELSDGERLIFYMLGQSLMVPKATTLIVDEPELHLNRSLIGKLWDKIESARSDCSFIYITHDIEFTNSRRGSENYDIKGMWHQAKSVWDIEKLPIDTGIPESVLTVIVGSRRPIMFVEGDSSSLDVSIYRRVFTEFTVIPVGGCDQVIHSVSTFKSHAALVHVESVGIVDNDGRKSSAVSNLKKKGVFVIPVSEVENLLLLPDVVSEIALCLHFCGADQEAKINEVREMVMSTARADVDGFALRHTKRTLDDALKKIDLKAKSIEKFAEVFGLEMSAIDPKKIYDEAVASMNDALDNGQYEKVLQIYDRKGLLSEAAKILGVHGRRELEEFVGRALLKPAPNSLKDALSKALPEIAI